MGLFQPLSGQETNFLKVGLRVSDIGLVPGHSIRFPQLVSYHSQLCTAFCSLGLSARQNVARNSNLCYLGGVLSISLILIPTRQVNFTLIVRYCIAGGNQLAACGIAPGRRSGPSVGYSREMSRHY